MEITIFFIMSQIVMGIAMLFDFLSLQQKERKKIFMFLIISASLICAHYFLLEKIVAGCLVFISILRFIVCYKTTSKKWLVAFLIANTVVLRFTYKEPFDLVIYIALFIIIIGNFQKNPKRMRKIMMVGSSTAVLYNLLILSPVGILAEGNMLVSNIIGYYRHYIKKDKKKRKDIELEEVKISLTE